jgi:hypothetical protein
MAISIEFTGTKMPTDPIDNDSYVASVTSIPSLLSGIGNNVDFTLKAVDIPPVGPVDPEAPPEVPKTIVDIEITAFPNVDNLKSEIVENTTIYDTPNTTSLVRQYILKLGESYTNATFNIVKKGKTLTASVVSPGTFYTVGDTFKILGTALGGYTPYNDIILTVTSLTPTNGVADASVKGVGNVDTVKISGNDINAFQEEIFKFVFDSKEEKILPPNNTEKWKAIIKWGNPPISEKELTYSIKVGYLDTTSDQDSKTAQINIKQFIYWNFVPSLATFKELVKRGT